MLKRYLSRYSTDSSRVGRAITEQVQNSVSNSVNASLTRYTNAWGYQIDSINISFKFDTTFYLPEEMVSNHVDIIYFYILWFIEQRDFFGTTGDTPYKDRDYSDRDSIVTYINPKIRQICSNLHYKESLDSTINTIARVIRREIQKIVNSAKLEMYK